MYLCHRCQWIHLFRLFLCYWMTLPKISTFSHKRYPSSSQLNTWYTITNYRLCPVLVQEWFNTQKKKLWYRNKWQVCVYHYWRPRVKRISSFRFHLVTSIISKCTTFGAKTYFETIVIHRRPQALNMKHETYKCL